MKIQLNGRADITVADKQRAREEIARYGLPEPPAMAMANSYSCPLGASPGRAWVCVRQQDLFGLPPELPFTLVFDDELNNFGPLVIDDLTYIKGVCLTPGKPDDPDAVYLAEFADRRYRVHNQYFWMAFEHQYNVLGRNGVVNGYPYYENSMDIGGSPAARLPWTWDRMVQNVWEYINSQVTNFFPPWPNLPTTLSPNGEPHNFSFIGTSAWLALFTILDRLSLTLSYNPVTKTFTFIQYGDADPLLSNLQQKYLPYLIYDAYADESQRGKTPYGVSVYYNRNNAHYGSEETTPVRNQGPGDKTPGHSDQWLTQPGWWRIDVDAQDIGFTRGEQKVYHPIWDDAVVFTDAFSGIYTASALALTQRAKDRATNYFKSLKQSPRLHQIYSGVVPFLPSGQIKGVCWRQDNEGGLVTEIVNHAQNFLRVGDDGRFTECDCTGRNLWMQAPNFNPQYPIYPHLLQTVKIVGTPTSIFYPAVVEMYDPDQLQWFDREPCYVIDANNS